MSGSKQKIEARGATVEDAINAGLTKLSLSRADVIVEILDEGSKGLLGIGARDAVVQLTPLVSQPAPPAPTVPKPQPKAAPAPASAPAAPAAVEPSAAESRDEVSDEELEETGETATAVVAELMAKMGFDVAVDYKLSDVDDMTGRRMVIVEISGEDLGTLIGPHGETLNAIQYLTRLMVGHKLHRRAELMVDVQGYRERRSQALARLAERMAHKALKRRRPMILEPMPPYERRIIHMTLRDFEGVTTSSVGEGKRRRVRIIPK
ncbi:MAG: protein jag [Candidatus Thermofonsia bacterium]|nr:MAG: protein jag [Candidatus Thermofonsia bacterium]